MNGADTQPVFTGVAVGLVTFFDAHGHVDLAATARHAEHLAGRGMRALVVAGTTGEASHLSMKERLQLLDAVRGAVGDDVPVILGTGNLAAGVSVPDLTRRAAQLGATGAILAVANLEPELCVDAFAGSVTAQKDLLGAHKILSCYGVKGIKEELARRHGTSTVCR